MVNGSIYYIDLHHLHSNYIQMHVAVMIVAVLMVITAVILILVHSEWKWLNTTVRIDKLVVD